MIRIADGLTDDSDFLGLLDSLVGGLIARFNPEEVLDPSISTIGSITSETEFFRHRYCPRPKLPRMFETLGIFRPTCLPRDKVTFYQKKVTFPRRSPQNRILGQWSYCANCGWIYGNAPAVFAP